MLLLFVMNIKELLVAGLDKGLFIDWVRINSGGLETITTGKGNFLNKLIMIWGGKKICAVGG